MPGTSFATLDSAMVVRAADLLERLAARGLTLATAESCTGGLVAGLLTEPAGASRVVLAGFVTYSNAAKARTLGVAESLLEQHGAVSEPVARAMAEGALSASDAEISVAITGIAGPDGGSAEKPVGLVHFAAAKRGSRTLHVEQRFGAIGRGLVRRAAVLQALDLIEEIAEG